MSRNKGTFRLGQSVLATRRGVAPLASAFFVGLVYDLVNFSLSGFTTPHYRSTPLGRMVKATRALRSCICPSFLSAFRRANRVEAYWLYGHVPKRAALSINEYLTCLLTYLDSCSLI